jgi:uncharacterized protein YdaU (DUF1376 family)
VNYYERHLGDYARDTGHLSLLEHGVFTLLLDRYYATEKPIPAVEVYRVCRARTKDEKQAVDSVISEFFLLEDGSFRNKKADSLIEEFQEGEGERTAEKANNKERQRRARERRKALFDQLRELGLVPEFKSTNAELEAMLSRSKSQVVTRDVTRDNTATHTPYTRHQTPIDQELASHSSTAEPSTELIAHGIAPPADMKAHRAQRLAQITDEAIETFNASALVKPNGGLLATVSPKVGREKRQQQIARCLRTAKAICLEDYDSQTITREFLEDYWNCCAADEHKSGRRGGGKDHPDWRPTFEYLTREQTMLEVYDRVKAEAAA